MPKVRMGKEPLLLFSEELRRQIAQENWAIPGLSGATGIPKARLRKILANEAGAARLTDIVALAALFDLPLDRFFSGDCAFRTASCPIFNHTPRPQCEVE